MSSYHIITLQICHCQHFTGHFYRNIQRFFYFFTSRTRAGPKLGWMVELPLLGQSGQSALRPVCGLRPAAQSHYFYISISSQVSKGLCADPLTLSVLSWTSEGSGWLSLLEADGRPKARRPQLYEAWFEHARAMSRGIPMDDGCMAGLSQCVCLCVCVCERFGWDEWLCRLSLWRLGQQLPSRILSVYSAANLTIYGNAQKFQRDVGQGQIKELQLFWSFRLLGTHTTLKEILCHAST